MSKAKDKTDKQVQNQGAASEGNAAPSALQKPSVFHFHDYVEYLNQWLKYKKQNHKGFSLRKLASAAGISTGYLPMVLSHKRPLSIETLNKLLPMLEFSKTERQFFDCIHSLGTTSSQEERVECLNRMKRYSAYREYYPNESEVYRYLTKWYYPAIREMSADPEFKLDADWVQARLRVHVPLADVKEALNFLIENKYIIVAKNGMVRPPEKHLNCEGGIYKVALTQYHKQLLELAEKSIENTPSTERNIVGHTFAIPESKFEDVRALIEETLNKIQNIAQDANGEFDSVYHIEMALFPLTKNKGEK